MRYSSNSTNHCHVSCTTDSRLELGIYQKKKRHRINDTSELYGLRTPSRKINAQEIIKL
jgi:hypothetical protein